MYTRNKVRSAEEQGYVPLVFHSNMWGSQIYVQELNRFKDYGFSELRYELCVVSRRKKGLLINKIKNILKDYDEESIIESHEMLVAQWGEWMAKALGIRHMAYMLLEHNDITNKSLYDFFKFKYNRRELVGICHSTIPDMFRPFDNGQPVVGYYLPAHCINTYEDVPCPAEYLVNSNNLTIGSIGRTNKRYVLPMIEAILKFVTKYKEKQFNILYVGGSANKESEKQLIAKFAQISNVNFYFTGMLFPIPISMIKQMDVCVASAGACVVSYKCGVPTISVDANDSCAIGVYRQTTMNSLFRDKDEPKKDIEALLEKVLIEKKYIRRDGVIPVKIDFTSHWDFIKKMDNNKMYYDLTQITMSCKEKFSSIVLGYYYGLHPHQLRYRLLKRVITMYSGK